MSQELQFAPQSLEEWKGLLQKESKGLGVDDFLLQYFDSITCEPFYNEENAQKLQVAKKETNEWDIVQRHIAAAGKEKELNKDLLQQLNLGVNGLQIKAEGELNWELFLKDIGLAYITFILEESDKNSNNSQSLAQYIQKHYPNERLNVFVLSGNGNTDFQAVSLTIMIDLYGLAHTGLAADYCLAIGLAQINEIWAKHPQQKIAVRLSSKGDFYWDLCMVRAFRHMAQVIGKSYGVHDNMYILGSSGLFNKCSTDKHNNMLRSSLEAMAMALGGVDALHIWPYDYGFAATEEFSLRMARNQSLLAIHESKVAKIKDAAEGSYFLETLTQKTIESVTQHFLTIEEEGGFTSLLSSEKLIHNAASSADKLIEEYKNAKRILLGFNKFQPQGEQAVSSDIDLGKALGVLPTFIIQDKLLAQ